MVYTYTPTYYTSLHDSIASLCKSILPFSFKKRRLPAIAAAEQQLAKQQSDNLKWQQESFHQILNLMGLCKEGILAEAEVSAFRTHLLEMLIASPIDHEPPLILRDKLIFLQELFHSKCISEDEYHKSKRPLLQRLAVQGAEIEARDVIVGANNDASNDEWSVIDLKEEKREEISHSKNKAKQCSAMRQIKGAASVLGFTSQHKHTKLVDDNKPVNDPSNENIRAPMYGRNELLLSTENPFWNSHLKEKESETKSILMAESVPVKIEKQSDGGKSKRKPFTTLFQREQKEGHGSGNENHGPDPEEKVKSGKKLWGFDGFKKCKKNDSENETTPLSLTEKSDGESYNGRLVMNPVGEGPDTKQIKRKLLPDGAPSDFFVDKVLGENIKRELFRIQSDFHAKNPNADLSDEQIEAISTRLPVDKADLKKFFPKSWCDQYGDIVLDVVRKEFKNHVGEMGTLRGTTKEKQSSKKWTTFDDDDEENAHPNLFAPQYDSPSSVKQMRLSSSKTARSFVGSSTDKGFKYNPFFDV